MRNLPTLASNGVDAIRAYMVGVVRRIIGWDELQTVFAPAAGGTVTFDHSLGVKPERIYLMPWLEAATWVSEDDRRLWNERRAAFSIVATADGVKVDVSVGLR